MGIHKQHKWTSLKEKQNKGKTKVLNCSLQNLLKETMASGGRCSLTDLSHRGLMKKAQEVLAALAEQVFIGKGGTLSHNSQATKLSNPLRNCGTGRRRGQEKNPDSP